MFKFTYPFPNDEHNGSPVDFWRNLNFWMKQTMGSTKIGKVINI